MSYQCFDDEYLTLSSNRLLNYFQIVARQSMVSHRNTNANCFATQSVLYSHHSSHHQWFLAYVLPTAVMENSYLSQLILNCKCYARVFTASLQGSV